MRSLRMAMCAKCNGVDIRQLPIPPQSDSSYVVKFKCMSCGFIGVKR